MKKAFSLIEILISMAIIGIVMAISLPTLMQNKPDESKTLFLKTYKEFSQVIDNLVNNSSLYPLCNGNNCPDRYRNFPLANTCAATMEDGTSIGVNNAIDKQTKFIRAFLNSFNITPPATWTDNLSNNEVDIEFKNGVTLLGNNNVIALRGANNYNYALLLFDSDNGTFKVKLTVDVNGVNNDPNCVYDANNCTNPDRFILYVAGDGKIYFGDLMGYAHVQQPDTRVTLLDNGTPNDQTDDIRWKDATHSDELQLAPNDSDFDDYFDFYSNTP